jgi:hypothetical protein
VKGGCIVKRRILTGMQEAEKAVYRKPLKPQTNPEACGNKKSAG